MYFAIKFYIKLRHKTHNEFSSLRQSSTVAFHPELAQIFCNYSINNNNPRCRTVGFPFKSNQPVCRLFSEVNVTNEGITTKLNSREFSKIFAVEENYMYTFQQCSNRINMIKWHHSQLNALKSVEKRTQGDCQSIYKYCLFSLYMIYRYPLQSMLCKKELLHDTGVFTIQEHD